MTPGRHVTMKDIAQEAAVSQSTVSRILSGAPVAISVSEETRTRVLATAERLHYRPNPLARALRGAPTMLLGAIVRDITDPFFLGAIDALSRAARARGYAVVLGNAREAAHEALALATILETRQCDALVLIGDVHDQPTLLADLAGLEVPVIELWSGSEAWEFPKIGADNRGGMRAVIKHLQGLGHLRIGFVGEMAKADIRERWEAAIELTGPDLLTADAQNSASAAARALDVLLSRPEPPTAIAAATDVLAFGVLHRAHALGLRVPEDLAVTGFDDISLAATAVPALTTVRMPTAAVMDAAMELAVGEGRGDVPARARLFGCELVVRASCGAPPPLGGGARLEPRALDEPSR